MTTYGITPAGLNRKSLTVLLDELAAAVKDAFGVDKRVDAKSPMWLLLSIAAQPVGEVWEVLESLFGAFDPDSAAGAALDNVLAFAGLTRKSRDFSTVTQVLVGKIGFEVAAASLISTQNAGDQFATDSDLTFAAAACYEAVIKFDETVDSGDVFTVTLNGRAYSYTSPGSDDEDDVFADIKAQIEAGADAALVSVDFTAGSPSSATMTITAANTTRLFTLAVTATLTIFSVGNLMTCTAAVEGAVPAYANKLTVIDSPANQWLSTYNPADAELGNTVETDAEARQRRAQSLAIAGAGTPPSILSHLLAINGVTNATVLYNRGDAADANNLEPHSILAVVLGGSDADIAAVMWERAGGGTGLNIGNANYSLTSVTVTDSQGESQTVGFQRPTDQDMWVRLTYSLNTEETFPDDGEDKMAAAALAYGITHNPNNDVLPDRFYGAVFDAVPGVKTLTVEVALDSGGSPGAYQSTPYAITPAQIARFAALRITVTT